MIERETRTKSRSNGNNTYNTDKGKLHGRKEKDLLPCLDGARVISTVSFIFNATEFIALAVLGECASVRAYMRQ